MEAFATYATEPARCNLATSNKGSSDFGLCERSSWLGCIGGTTNPGAMPLAIPGVNTAKLTLATGCRRRSPSSIPIRTFARNPVEHSTGSSTMDWLSKITGHYNMRIKTFLTLTMACILAAGCATHKAKPAVSNPQLIATGSTTGSTRPTATSSCSPSTRAPTRFPTWCRMRPWRSQP